MSDDLLSLASRISDRATAGEDVEAFVTHEREFRVTAYQGEVESLSSAEPRGAGIRVVKDHRVGFAYTTDLSESGLTAVLDKARDNATYASEDPAAALAESHDGWTDLPGLADERFAAAPDDKVAFALSLEEAARTKDDRVRTVEDAVYADSETVVAIATSTGVAGSYRRTDAWCYVVAIATDGDDTEVGFEFDLARALRGLEADEIAARAVQRAVGTLGAQKIASARMPIVFDPYTAGQFLGVLGSVLTAEAVQKGRSLFAGRLGDQVAASKLSLVDDGRAEGAPASAPWDGEGVPTSRTSVISNGVLESFLYDLISARRDGRSSTGNASRSGFKSPPGPSPSNLAFESTGETRAEVLAGADGGLYVQDFHGVHSGANPITGDFSVGVTGRLIEAGRLTAPVKEVTIAAPMLEILRRTAAVADDRRWLPFGGSYGGATTLIEEMTVAGR